MRKAKIKLSKDKEDPKYKYDIDDNVFSNYIKNNKQVLPRTTTTTTDSTQTKIATPKIEITKEQSVWKGERIGVPYYDHIKNDFPLPQDNMTLGIIVGKSGSGKSFMLTSLLPSFKQLDTVIIASFVINNPVNLGVGQWCKEKKINFIFSSELDQVAKAIKDTILSRKEGTQCLVIFDDFIQGGHKSHSNPYVKLMETSFNLLRNYGFSLIFVTQRYISVPLNIRNNSNLMIGFKQSDVQAVVSFTNNFVENIGIEKAQFTALYSKVKDTAHSFIMGSVNRVFVYTKEDDNFEEIDVIQTAGFNSEYIDHYLKTLSQWAKKKQYYKDHDVRLLAMAIHLLIDVDEIPYEKIREYVRVKYDIDLNNLISIV